MTNYTTGQFDNPRTGWNPNEKRINIYNVSKIQRLFVHEVDGQVYAQPLYIQGVAIPGKGTHNVVYVATAGGTVYAFDADQKMDELWTGKGVSLLKPPILQQPESAVSPADVQKCPNIAPKISIISTPVIDPSTGTIYVVAKSKDNKGNFHFRLHALDISTGAEKFGGPVEIKTLSSQMQSRVYPSFNPQWSLNRPALLLNSGTIYIAIGSNCDFHAGDYFGWVMAYDAKTLQQIDVLNVCPDTVGNPSMDSAGIWQSGCGLAADKDGYVYCATGNGDFNVFPITGGENGIRDYGNCILKIQLAGTPPTLSINDYFVPIVWGDLNVEDTDVGSGGVMVLPDQADTNTPKLLVACGKQHVIYLMDRTNLGKLSGYSKNVNKPDVNLVSEVMLNTLGGVKNPTQVPSQFAYPQGGVWGGPAYFEATLPSGQSTPVVYYCGDADFLKGFSLRDGQLSQNPIFQSNDKYGSGNQKTPNGGSIPVVSSFGLEEGSAIVWIIKRSDRNTGGGQNLQAYDALKLGDPLASFDAGPWDNQQGMPFLVPTVVNGKVYVGTGGDGQVNNDSSIGTSKGNGYLYVFGLPPDLPRGGTVIIGPGIKEPTRLGDKDRLELPAEELHPSDNAQPIHTG